MPVSYRIVAYQCIFAAVLACVMWLKGPGEAIAVLLAGIASIVPNSYFAWCAEHGTNAHRLMGQGGMKVLLTITLLAVVFSVARPEPLGFFLAFIGLHLVHVFAGLLGARR